MADTPPSEIPFQELLDAMGDLETPFHPRYLYRLSDLDLAEVAQLEELWPRLPLWRRKALLEDLEELGAADLVLSFEAVCRHALQDEHAEVRRLAISILDDYQVEDLIPRLLDIVSTDEHSAVRAQAARALGSFVYLGEIDDLPQEVTSQIEDRLFQAIENDPVGEVRQRALESLGYSSREELPELIAQAFASGEKEWMASALLAMGRSVDPRWEDRVLNSLGDKWPRLREESARAAGELELSEAVESLIELLDDTEKSVRLAASWSLSQIGGEGVQEALEQLLEDADDDEEINLLENALDNLAFTEEVQLLPLFDFSETDSEYEPDSDDLLVDDEDLLD